ncbi:hypothetical protein [Ruminiclostridium papyrosolvens]|uniref:hypothetical protein n=1 Tax=Ruminiclostridium papyrosolvens TaxID=29362 RepID=UPI00040C4247|nr:hypothetical protein [Ruminiclostridium papyrosolvens]
MNNKGAEATIETQNLSVISSASAWAMTCDGNSGSTGYVQVGWLKYPVSNKDFRVGFGNAKMYLVIYNNWY